MKVTTFTEKIAKREKGKEISIAQIKEVTRIINDLTKGMLYRIVREL